MALTLLLSAGPAEAQNPESVTRLQAMLSTEGLSPRTLPGLDGAATIRLPQRADVIRAPSITNDFMENHLLPRMSSKLDRVAARHPQAGSMESLIDHPMYGELSDAVERRALSGVKRAVRDYVLQTSVFRSLTRVYANGRQKAPQMSGGSFDFGVGVAHARPRVELRHRTGNTETRFGVGMTGHVNLEFSHNAEARTRLSMEYDPRHGEYLVGLRFGL